MQEVVLVGQHPSEDAVMNLWDEGLQQTCREASAVSQSIDNSANIVGNGSVAPLAWRGSVQSQDNAWFSRRLALVSFCVSQLVSQVALVVANARADRATTWKTGLLFV